MYQMGMFYEDMNGDINETYTVWVCTAIEDLSTNFWQWNMTFYAWESMGVVGFPIFCDIFDIFDLDPQRYFGTSTSQNRIWMGNLATGKNHARWCPMVS
jgi:hypothetical protein